MSLLEQLQFNSDGHIPAIIVDDVSGQVLTLCYMTREALQETLEEGKVYVFRRSRKRLTIKGETSGHIQIVKEIFVDCEANSLLFRVEQKVAACHAGYFTCYYRRVNKNGALDISEEKIFNPEMVY